MLIYHLHIFFGEVPEVSLAHFLIRLFIFFLLSLKSSLFILDNNPLSNIANIFSQSVFYLSSNIFIELFRMPPTCQTSFNAL